MFYFENYQNFNISFFYALLFLKKVYRALINVLIVEINGIIFVNSETFLDFCGKIDNFWIRI